MNKPLTLISLFILLAISQAVSNYELESLWEAWKIQHMKSYDPIEETSRFGIFSHNYKKIVKFNEENDTPKLALNQFADLTTDEFKVQYATGGFYDVGARVPEVIEDVDVEALPTSVDWRNKGAVTAVKNQGQCGACVFFTTTGLLEGFYFINHGKLLSFSEQQIVDCDTKEAGCDGGWPYLVIEYAAKYGLETEEDYPYTGAEGDCQYNQSLAVKIDSNYSYVTPNSTNQLKAAVVKSPVAVLVEADQDVWRFYSSGVIKTGCGAQLDFSALVVGYHMVGPIEAFILKSSWGSSWGEDGYVQVWSNSQQNGGQGVCGILAQPVTAIKKCFV